MSLLSTTQVRFRPDPIRTLGVRFQIGYRGVRTVTKVVFMELPRRYFLLLLSVTSKSSVSLL